MLGERVRKSNFFASIIMWRSDGGMKLYSMPSSSPVGFSCSSRTIYLHQLYCVAMPELSFEKPIEAKGRLPYFVWILDEDLRFPSMPSISLINFLLLVCLHPVVSLSCCSAQAFRALPSIWLRSALMLAQLILKEIGCWQILLTSRSYRFSELTSLSSRRP
jgi:hypothetical protein